MQGIAKCPLCGEEPYQHGKDSYSKYGISCCGHTIWEKDNPTSWNRYAAAMELAILRSKYERECDMMGDEEQKELWDEITNANKRVLEAFK